MALTYESIATYTTPNNSTTSYTFSSIPSTYTDLRLICVGNFASSNDRFKLVVNGETNFTTRYVLYDASAGNPTASSGTSNNIVFSSTDSGSDSQFLWLDLFNYAQNNKQSYQWKYAMGRNASTSAPAMFTGQTINTNNAITISSITISGVSSFAFSSGTNFTLYALKAA